MALSTLHQSDIPFAVKRLQKINMPFFEQQLNNCHCNLFFGSPECIATIRLIINRPLNALSPEEDFILGILLGYNVNQQCIRYCTRKNNIFKTA